ncbi:MAG TPA: ThiF family adenylyltransferase [Anaeromyxobacteraceae bacterium]|nr:ThiF family adenylyltransferase [Anaeromyxobacteraceae bacterium]
MGTPEGRHSRQERFAPVGAAGQARIRAARVLVAGCGGLGSNAANLLARAGVGLLRIADRDAVEPSNLHRQALFTDADAREGTPKALAAARAIAAIDPGVKVEPVVADVAAGNVLALLEGVDLAVDGFDSFEARYLLNDACVRLGLPWVHGACLGSTAMARLVVPGATPCLRCLRRDVPERRPAETSEVAGILGPAVALAASLQAAMALRFLVERAPPPDSAWICADVWDLRVQRLELPPPDEGCPCCAGRARASAPRSRSARRR